MKDKTGEIAAKGQRILDARIDSLDFCAIVCQAVIDEFPQIKENPKVVDYFKRLREFLRQEEARNKR